MSFAIRLVLFTICGFISFNYGQQTPEFSCQNVQYLVNECNICVCFQGLLPNLICTRRGCDDEEEKYYSSCTVGRTWTKDCNDCWCVKEVGTVCTTKLCPSESFTKDWKESNKEFNKETI